VTNQYDDLLHLPHPTSERHPRMPMSDRAAIFSPFAALTGHGAAIVETARLTGRRIEPDEDSRAKLNWKQRVLAALAAEQPEVTVTWFQPDERKDGGSYATVTGRLKKTDGVERVMVLADGTRIPLDDILDIESERLQDMMQEDV